jgi:hypothetical protein
VSTLPVGGTVPRVPSLTGPRSEHWGGARIVNLERYSVPWEVQCPLSGTVPLGATVPREPSQIGPRSEHWGGARNANNRHSNEFGDFVVIDFFQWIFQSMFMMTMVLIVILPLNFP